jgi:hypothetical protein
LLYYILGNEGVTPTTVALLMMSLVIELMLGDTMYMMISDGVKVLLNIIIAEGEMMAIVRIVVRNAFGTDSVFPLYLQNSFAALYP